MLCNNLGALRSVASMVLWNGRLAVAVCLCWRGRCMGADCYWQYTNNGFCPDIKKQVIKEGKRDKSRCGFISLVEDISSCCI